MRHEMCLLFRPFAGLSLSSVKASIGFRAHIRVSTLNRRKVMNGRDAEGFCWALVLIGVFLGCISSAHVPPSVCVFLLSLYLPLSLSLPLPLPLPLPLALALPLSLSLCLSVSRSLSLSLKYL